MAAPMDLQRTLADAAAGDAAALHALTEALYPRVRELVHRELQHDFRRRHRWILPLFSTRDVVHDVFAAVLRGLGSARFDGEPALLRYLASAVQHRILDALRHHEAGRRDARRKADEPEGGLDALARSAGAPSPATEASLREQIALYRAALGELPERERLLLDLRLADETPFGELAGRLAYPSADAARKAFHVAQARLLVKLRALGLTAPEAGP